MPPRGGDNKLVDKTGSLWEWMYPSAFVICGAWMLWHMPAYILDFVPPGSESLFSQIRDLHLNKDWTPEWPGLFGGFADPIDWLALVLMPVVFVLGARNIKIAHMEYPNWRPIDRTALFLGRVTMILILAMASVMLYEVFLRYIFEDPTLWANELTLWIAGYVFLFSGLYAMQQRCHIRIFLFYDLVPRWLQHVFDVISTALLVMFTFFLVYGAFYQVFYIKFYKWEMFGTAFDPPIPATVQPMIHIVFVLIAIQAVLNLIADWNLEPEKHSIAADVDEDDLAAIKRGIGEA